MYLSQYLSYDKFSPSHHRFILSITGPLDPIHYIKAVKHQVWRDVMDAELEAVEQNKTWIMVSLPVGKHAIGYNRCTR